MSKIAALDLGDRWVGIALSDPMQIIARPHKTVPLKDLSIEFAKLIREQELTICVVGYPKTMKGTESDQTRTINAQTQQLAEQFPEITFVPWDERLSSQRAATLKPAKTSAERQFAHARAAAFILDSYLTYLAHQKALTVE